ncbi:hypothetical protein [Sphingobacterium multivorum]|uniref:hypothetical protein n=1 Tax=Sphingobacterium multivorum TaxID=28454 RepID=UPI003DA68C11
MIWPDFKTAVACTGSEQLFQLILQEKFHKHLIDFGTLSTLLNLEKKEIIPDDGFLYFPSWMNIYITEDFITQHFIPKTDVYHAFNSYLGDVFEMVGRTKDRSANSVRSAIYSFFYRGNNGKVLIFQMQNDTPDLLKKQHLQLLSFIADLMSGNSPEVEEAIEQSYSYNNAIYYVGYEETTWNVIDPLLYVAEQLNQEYKEHADLRAHKPEIILQQDKINQEHTFGDNWVLEFDGLSTLLNRPNDVSLYSSICEKNLTMAKRFYEDVILIRHKYHTGNFPLIEQQKEYFDYFELITTALIFAYSSIEAFINSFIPEEYTYKKPNGTKVLGREEIERRWPLKDKLKTILTDIYQTPNPENEEWWQDLVELQELRDQTIHTKQHYSQIRFSKLLSRNIYGIIDVYKVIITYYGKFIMAKNSRLINEFPYNFGFDQVQPYLMTEQTYKDIYNSLHNPSNPL